MNNVNLGVLNKIDKQWYLSLIQGFILVFVGIWIFINPEEDIISIAKYFSIIFLLTGLLEVASSIQYRNILKSWRYSLSAGIIHFIIGLILLIHSQISQIVLILLVGFVFFYRSLKVVIWAVELKEYEALFGGWLLFAGVFGFMISFLLLWNQSIPNLTFIFYASFALQMIGVSEIYYSFILRKLTDRTDGRSIK